MVTLTRETKGKEVVEQEKEKTDRSSSNNTKKTLGKGTRGLCVLSSWTSRREFPWAYVRSSNNNETDQQQAVNGGTILFPFLSTKRRCLSPFPHHHDFKATERKE